MRAILNLLGRVAAGAIQTRTLNSAQYASTILHIHPQRHTGPTFRLMGPDRYGQGYAYFDVRMRDRVY